MQTSRLLTMALLAGSLVVTSVPKARAMDPYTPDLLSQVLSGVVAGTPSGAYGTPPSGAAGMSPYDPYGNSPSGPYRRPHPGSYGLPPYGAPSGLGGGYARPLPEPYGLSPYDSYPSRGPRYRYQERRTNDYAKAMSRLERQEAQAQAKAARRSYGDPARYQDRMAKIDRKYNYKRYKVERNTASGYRRPY